MSAFFSNVRNYQEGRISLVFLMILAWFVYMVMKPIYIFPKGLPQPSDFLLTVVMIPGLFLAFLKSPQRIPLVYFAGGLFAALTFTINWINFGFHPGARLALSSLYYPYNFMIFIFAVYLFKSNQRMMWKMTYYAVAISIVMQLVSAQFFPDFDKGGLRMTGGFKNPNQLAYWSILSAAILYFLKRYEKFSFLDILLFAAVGYIQTLALSKAGLISYGVFLVIALFSPQTPKIIRYLLLFVGLTSAVYFMFSPGEFLKLGDDIEAVERVSDRLDTFGQEADDSPEGRGYNRIVNNPEYLILGAGEGGFERFRTWASSNELHSGLATIIFSYGILGLFFFCMFLFFIFYRQPWHCAAILFAVFLFSVSSQTIRFTHTWVFLAVAYATFVVPRQNEDQIFYLVRSPTAQKA